MPASRESASGPRRTASDGAGGRVLVAGVNWLGDSVMTMPALREFARRRPAARLTMLVKPPLAPLWRMFPGVDSIIELGPGPLGVLRAARAVKAGAFGQAFVLTQSVRSALAPFLALVPERVGMPGHNRDWMLTAVVRPESRAGRRHQQFEYFDLMGMGDVTNPEPPSLAVPGDVLAGCRRRLETLLPGIPGRPLVGVFPGAAHGPSKCWPADRFADVAARLAEERGCGVLVFGSETDRAACATVAARAGGKRAADLSGGTTLPELAGMLSLCRSVLANDSGGMHLAAAAGARVIAVYGLTDPSRTGPLGAGHRVIAAEAAGRGRDIEPDSEAGRQAMLSISPDVVFNAAAGLIGEMGQ